MKYIISLILIIGLTVSTVYGQTRTVLIDSTAGVEDNYMYSGAINTNYGHANNLQIFSRQDPIVTSSIMRIPFTTITSDTATVTSCTLFVRVKSTVYTFGDFYVWNVNHTDFPMNVSFGELTSTYNKRDGTNSWGDISVVEIVTVVSPTATRNAGATNSPIDSIFATDYANIYGTLVDIVIPNTTVQNILGDTLVLYFEMKDPAKASPGYAFDVYSVDYDSSDYKPYVKLEYIYTVPTVTEGNTITRSRGNVLNRPRGHELDPIRNRGKIISETLEKNP